MLDLVLHPLIPVRRPSHGTPNTVSGYALRISDGFGLAEDDPLLAAFGVVVEPVGSDGLGEALQSDRFVPGSEILLLPRSTTLPAR